MQMWDLLRKADFERAKAQLSLRRTEMLTRHSQELQDIDAKQTELKTLNELIEGFARKFGVLTRAASAPRPVPPITHQIVIERTAPPPKPHHHRGSARTNFETFAQALARV